MKSAIVVFPGSNREQDARAALLQATGKEPAMVWHRVTEIPAVDLILIPGGFSYGDYLRCGAMAAHSPVMRDVVAKAKAGTMVLGICNGFQVLCEAGLLPGALLRNENLRFVCRQVDLIADGARQSPFLREIEPGERLSIPVKHGEGRYYAPEEMLDEIEANGQVAFRYAPGQNPNGSLRDVAGVLNEGGNVLGLMPHPEHAVDPLTGSVDGLKLFSPASSALANA
jgi:phosphoribosylformylglycinamidine synthase